MSAFLMKLVSQIVSGECAEKYLIEFDFFDGNLNPLKLPFRKFIIKLIAVDCFKASLSKGLGYGIIAGSLLVKVPQILKVLANKSAAGINIYAVFLDLLAITLNLSYSFVSRFPFSAYGDGAFLALQTLIIGCLVLHYGGSTVKALLVLVAYLAMGYVLMGGITPLHVLLGLQALNIPILLVGKSAQALTNYRNSSTGQLSAATCFMLFFGSLARIFTSYQETGDTMMILTYALSTSANAVIVAQLLWYWNSGDSKKKVAGKSQKKQTKPKTKKIE